MAERSPSLQESMHIYFIELSFTADDATGLINNAVQPLTT